MTKEEEQAFGDAAPGRAIGGGCTRGLNQAQIHKIDPFAVPRGLVSLAQPMGHFPGVYTPNGER